MCFECKSVFILLNSTCPVGIWQIGGRECKADVSCGKWLCPVQSRSALVCRAGCKKQLLLDSFASFTLSKSPMIPCSPAECYFSPSDLPTVFVADGAVPAEHAPRCVTLRLRTPLLFTALVHDYLSFPRLTEQV